MNVFNFILSISLLTVFISCNEGPKGDSPIINNVPDNATGGGANDGVTEGVNGRSCTSNPNPIFTSAIVNPSNVLVVIPPGLLTAIEPKGHSYIRSNVPSASSPVYAPVDMVLKKLIYYDSNVSDGMGGTYPVYILEFQVSCEITIWIDHLYQAVSSISALAPASPSPSTASQYEVIANVQFFAGDLIGYSQPFEFDYSKSQVDFGVRSTLAGNNFINTAVTPDKILYSKCPYNYFSAALKNQYEALYGDYAPVVSGQCRSAAIDVSGTISGYWYSSLNSGTGSGPYTGYLGIGLMVDSNQFQIGGLKNGQFSASLNGGPAPDNVNIGQEVCYSDGSSHVFFHLISNTQLRVAFKNGDSVCPGSFPISSNDYTIYETYSR